MNKIIKNITLILVSFSILLSIIVIGILWNFSSNIPDYKFLKNYKPPVSSKVYSVNVELGWTPELSGEYILKLYVMDATTMGAVMKNPIVNNIYVEPAKTSLASGPESTKN